MMYQDHDGNTVHHFDIPARHARLTLTADALVECDAPKPLPHRLGPGAWAQLDALAASGECWECLAPSTFARATPRARRVRAGAAPRARQRSARLLRRLMSGDVHALRVQPAEHARRLADRRGADGAARRVPGLRAHLHRARAASSAFPTRYVSGYLFRERRQSGPIGGRRHARVGGVVPAGARLGRLRSRPTT